MSGFTGGYGYTPTGGTGTPGTVTLVSGTAGYGLTNTVTNSTTTPNIAITPTAAHTVTVTAGAGTVNCALAAVFTASIIANTTFTLSGMLSGQTILLEVTASGVYSVTISPTCRFPGGSQPTQTASGTDIYTIAYDGTHYNCVVNQAFA
jgi:hypothetical protein